MPNEALVNELLTVAEYNTRGELCEVLTDAILDVLNDVQYHDYHGGTNDALIKCLLVITQQEKYAEVLSEHIDSLRE